MQTSKKSHLEKISRCLKIGEARLFELTEYREEGLVKVYDEVARNEMHEYDELIKSVDEELAEINTEEFNPVEP